MTDDDGKADVLVDIAESDGVRVPAEAEPVPGWREDRSRDLAILRLQGDLPGSLVPAVLDAGPAPAPGTLLAAFGFPRVGESNPRRSTVDLPNPGVWTFVTVDGTDMYGKLLQCTSRQPDGVRVQQGFSGGPMVEENTGLVVAMTAYAQERQALSYGLLARTIRAHLPPDMAEAIQAARRTPPALEHVVAALNRRGFDGTWYPDFPTARNGLAPLLGSDVDYPDLAYYVALTALGGQRPRDPAVFDVLLRIDRRLGAAYASGTRTPHLLALWALVKEDGFIGRGMGDSRPSADELRPAAMRTDAAHAEEICALVPAPESPTWQLLNRRRPHAR